MFRTGPKPYWRRDKQQQQQHIVRLEQRRSIQTLNIGTRPTIPWLTHASSHSGPVVGRVTERGGGLTIVAERSAERRHAAVAAETLPLLETHPLVGTGVLLAGGTGAWAATNTHKHTHTHIQTHTHTNTQRQTDERGVSQVIQ